MNSRDVVLRKEGDGKGYYQRCGAEAGIPGLSRIFNMLSEDETRHADALRALQDGGRVELPHSPTLHGAQSILRRLSIQEAALSDFNGDLRAYGSAMDFEAASARACGQLAREALHGWERDLFLKIAAEDEIHFTLLEHICDLLKPAPCAGAGEAGVPDAN
jgi:rubrerythrin